MRCLRTLCLLLLLALAAPAAADSVTVTGSAGAPGSDGGAGDPGSPGGVGADGQDAVAVADAGSQDNTATAIGGDGGAGGAGGDGSVAGADGGAGGDGGSGGDATAVATSDLTSATAIAQAGAGGAGGAGGAAFGGGTPGADGLPGLDGSASAEASVVSGGDAHATAEASGSGSGSVHATSDAQGAYDAGHADLSVSSSATAISSGPASGVPEGPVSADASLSAAEIRDGFDDVTVTAFASDDGSAAVSASAEARLGYVYLIPLPSDLGDILVSAEGHSGSGDVDVSARLQVATDAPRVELHDAVSGSTAGLLRLHQTLVAPTDVVGSLVASNPGGGDLDVDFDLLARHPNLVPGGTVLLGDVIGSSDQGGDVHIDVDARAGDGFSGPTSRSLDGLTVLQQATDGQGHTVPTQIHGASNGGDVDVRAVFRGGRGAGGKQAGAGGSVHMVDAVSGETSGALSLSQWALAGQGGDGFALPGQIAPGGKAGEAWSELHSSAESEQLVLSSRAAGGVGGLGSLGAVEDGGVATAIAEGTNTAGGVEIQVRASGGGPRRSFDPTQAARGGDAFAEAFGRTLGDGHDVVIGAAGSASALGGGDHPRPGALPNTRFGSGGDARSRSTGVAEGDSAVTVYDEARGGGGGGTSLVPFSGIGGDGGSADSQATALGSGIEAVLARSRAFAGDGGGNGTEGGDGGDAVASAVAGGLGHVESIATAIAGAAGDGSAKNGSAGSATAQASADGSSGFAAADAWAGGNVLPALRAATRVDIGSHASTGSYAGFGVSPSGVLPAEVLQQRGSLVGSPLGADVSQAIGRSAVLGDLFTADPGARMVALGEWNVGNDREGERALTATGEFDITLPESDGDRSLLLSIFDVQASGDGFEELSLRFERFGSAFGDEYVFDTLEEAIAFFEASLFDFGLASALQGDAPAIRAIFDVRLGAGDAFGLGLGFVSAVPEPATGGLVALGLVALAVRRRTAIA